jgi:UDP-N-acetylmuramate dehydrogenase
MQALSNYPLSKTTTFRLGGPALYLVDIIRDVELNEVSEFAKEKKLPIFIMGGGSNLLVADAGFKGIVVKISIKSRMLVQEGPDFVLFNVGSGEVWDEVVGYAVAQDWWGLENLSGIPGFTGAVPVQNVGAYGADASMVVENVEVMDIKSLQKRVFLGSECGFGYRQSHFNTVWKNKYVILSVTFRLSKAPQPNLAYADLKSFFGNNPSPKLTEIRQAVISIRKNKFPDISQLGNAGSCFKNPILNDEQYRALESELKKNFGEEVLNKLKEIKEKLQGKIPAAFLIDICGLKGKRVGGAKLWDRQPLVIVNEGNATSLNVVELINQVRDEVLAKIGIKLEIEPELVGFDI